jgi:hypothetical protein
MADPLSGKTLCWTFDDGPTAGTTYQHVFGTDGRVRWSQVNQGKPGEPGKDSEAEYKASEVAEGVLAVSYLAPSGFTLTTILDTEEGTVVAYASNEEQLFVQHGTFEEVKVGDECLDTEAESGASAGEPEVEAAAD